MGGPPPSPQAKPFSCLDPYRTTSQQETKACVFQTWDLVMVKLQHYRQTSLASHRFQKLSQRYYGPFSIVEQVGSVAYRLQLPVTSKIHNVFHVSTLKLFKGRDITTCKAFPQIAINNSSVSWLVAIVATREVLHANIYKKQVLIQWHDANMEDNTWEDFEDFQKLYPAFQLEDKLVF